MRAARTDAGVSAAVNVLNIKLILSPPSKDPSMTIEAHINSFLPPAVRVWKIIRVQGSFHSRTMCDSRMYNYSLPTYVFVEPKDGTPMSSKITWSSQEEKDDSYWVRNVPSESATISSSENQPPSDPSSEKVPSTSSFQIDQALRKQYRIPSTTLSRLRTTLNAYTGSHNFWNFTIGKEFGDRSCQRMMKRLEVTEPFMVNDTEWISLKFHGQSFMLHQIVRDHASVPSMRCTSDGKQRIAQDGGPCHSSRADP